LPCRCCIRGLPSRVALQWVPPMETGPFASLAQIRILLIPVGPIRRSAFEKYAGLVRSFEHIRLGDIPPDPREDKSAPAHPSICVKKNPF
jgi:Transport protein Trs120 or TRAPPC9, TRAPP II complex subunit